MLLLSQIIDLNVRMIYITRTGNKMEGTVQNLFCVTTAEFGWSY